MQQRQHVTMALWEWMGSGVPSGLQNQYKELGASWVGSIPTLSRQSITINLRVLVTYLSVSHCCETFLVL